MEKEKRRLTKSKKKLIAVILIIVLAIGGTTGGILYYRDLYACQYVKQISASDIQGSKKVTLISHRGVASEAPENTLPAYEIAAEKGFKYAETDIRLTKDGVWVLSHDSSLGRMTGFSGKIEEMTLAEVREHPLTHGANIKKYPNLITPTYSEFVKLCYEKGLIPVVEIKTEAPFLTKKDYQKIITELDIFMLTDKAYIISFDKDALAGVRKVDPDISMQLLSKTLNDDTLKTARELEAGLDIEQKAILKNPENVKKALKQGFVLNAWTVDKADNAEQLISLGVTMLTTNAIMP